MYPPFITPVFVEALEVAKQFSISKHSHTLVVRNDKARTYYVMDAENATTSRLETVVASYRAGAHSIDYQINNNSTYGGNLISAHSV